MWIMNIVWPATALYLSVFALWGYFRYGRRMARDAMQHNSAMLHNSDTGKRKPQWHQYAISTSHCGAGCTIADIFAESGSFALGLTLFGLSLWASYAVDFAAAWLLGIVFQYFSIKPMKKLSSGEALFAAVKADTLSIVAFQVGMYAWMALTFFVFFPSPHLTPNEPAFWFMMQIAMVLGFATAYPMNVWLVSIGVKEAMG